MENFKQIAEDCLAGKLSGTFVLRNGGSWKSNTLRRYSIEGKLIPDYYVLGKGIILDSNGLNMKIKERVQRFIPDVKKEQITIDIPEGMTVIREETPGEIKIKFAQKQLNYDDIWESLDPKLRIFPFATPDSNKVNDAFFDKVNVLRKLTNIRNYFGEPDDKNGWYINIDCQRKYVCIEISVKYNMPTGIVVFNKKEHAEQAIKMLGDELKYLFEPW